MRILFRWLAALLLSALAVGAAEPKDMEALEQRVRAEIAPFQGKVALYAKNLETGASLSVEGDERTRTASTIKVPIMVAAFARVAEGKAKWDDEIVLTKEKKQPDGGVLQELHDGIRLTLRDAVNLMIVVSDNTGANLVLDAISTDGVNEIMDALDLQKTRSLGKIGGGMPSRARNEPVNAKKGIGVTTPHEMVALFEMLERGQVINPEASAEMIALLKREQFHEGIGRRLKDVPMACKPGSLDHLRADVAIIYAPSGRVAMAITCDDMPEIDYTNDNPALLLMSRLSTILLDGLSR